VQPLGRVTVAGRGEDPADLDARMRGGPITIFVCMFSIAVSNGGSGGALRGSDLAATRETVRSST
jgi:hypothetical protein